MPEEDSTAQERRTIRVISLTMAVEAEESSEGWDGIEATIGGARA